jgi:hypothetical protein
MSPLSVNRMSRDSSSSMKKFDHLGRHRTLLRTYWKIVEGEYVGSSVYVERNLLVPLLILKKTVLEAWLLHIRV